MKLFSGDDKGKIVYSALDLDQVSICYRDLNSHLHFLKGFLCVSRFSSYLIAQCYGLCWMALLVYVHLAQCTPSKATTGHPSELPYLF